MDRYLQLPDNISTRVRKLAREFMAAHDNTFDRVQALSDHLLTNYPYNFYPPPHPPSAEVVDQFLFVDQGGVCKQHVTAFVIMARSLGIPARLTAGYGAGHFNPVTGYYEVRHNDAHAWAEVYFPQAGWVPFDPTPGWTPQPYPTPVQNWLFANNGQLLEQFTGFDMPVGAMATGVVSGVSVIGPFLIAAVLLGVLLICHFTWGAGSGVGGPPVAARNTAVLMTARTAHAIKFYEPTSVEPFFFTGDMGSANPGKRWRYTPGEWETLPHFHD